MRHRLLTSFLFYMHFFLFLWVLTLCSAARSENPVIARVELLSMLLLLFICLFICSLLVCFLLLVCLVGCLVGRLYPYVSIRAQASIRTQYLRNLQHEYCTVYTYHLPYLTWCILHTYGCMLALSLTIRSGREY